MQSVYRGVSFSSEFGWVATLGNKAVRGLRSEHEALAARQIMESGILKPAEVRRLVWVQDLPREADPWLSLRERKRAAKADPEIVQALIQEWRDGRISSPQLQERARALPPVLKRGWLRDELDSDEIATNLEDL